MDQVTAIIPAGGRLSEQDAKLCGARVKALLPIGGETLLERLLRVLQAVESVQRVVVVGPQETRAIAEQAGAGWSIETGALLGNVQAGVQLAALTGADRVLLIGSDLAMPAAASIADFIARSPAKAQVTVPLVSREAFEEAYPGSPGAFVPLREGQFTIGSQFLAPAELLHAPPSGVAAMLGNRKSQAAMALTFGLPVALRLLTKTLTVRGLEQRASILLGVPAAAVPDCAPDLAFDIDNVADYRYAVSLPVQIHEPPTESNKMR